MKLTKLILLAIVLGFASSGSAELLRFDFNGRTYIQQLNGDPITVTGTYQGYFLIDSTVENTGDSSFFSIFENSLVQGDLIVNGISYSIAASGINRSGITNNAGATFDSFYVTANMVSEFGQEVQFALQLVDSTNEIYGLDDLMNLPVNLTHEDFDPWNPNVISDTGTIGLLFSPGAPLLTVDSANLRVVPVPAAWFLLVSGLLFFRRQPK